MNYKLMIVEDEALAREAIVKSIDFAAIGFELAAVCEDGQEALEAYEQVQPDLVVTDICMPHVSGLDLAGKIAESGRDTLIMILTGYDDFEYARTAISHKVEKYILKPVTSAEFRKILAEAKITLDDQRIRREQIMNAQRMLHIHAPLARDQMLSRLLHGLELTESNLDEARELKFDLYKPAYQVNLIQPDKPDAAVRKLNVNHSLLSFMIFNIVQELAEVDEQTQVFSLPDGRAALLAAGDSEQKLEQKQLLVCQQLVDTVNRVLHIEVVVGMGKIVESSDKIKITYRSAEDALEYRFIFPGIPLITQDVLSREPKPLDNPLHIEETLLGFVKTHQLSQAEKCIQDYVVSTRQTSHSRSEMLYAALRLAERLKLAVNDSGYQLPDTATAPLPDDFDFMIKLKVWLTGICREAVAALARSRQTTTQKLAVQAEAYIQAHYADQDLSLMQLCQHLSVSMSYFSSFFKEETGKTFIEYLTDLRMEKAKNLLAHSDLMLYRIAEEVGYEHPAYFTANFKKQTGFKPKEYRRRFRQEQTS